MVLGTVRPVFQGKPRSENVFKKPLEQCRHCAVPERKQEHPVLCPAHVLSGLQQCRRDRAGLEIHLRSLEWKFELGHFDPAYFTPRRSRTFCVTIGQHV